MSSRKRMPNQSYLSSYQYLSNIHHQAKKKERRKEKVTHPSHALAAHRHRLAVYVGLREASKSRIAVMALDNRRKLLYAPKASQRSAYLALHVSDAAYAQYRLTRGCYSYKESVIGISILDK